MNGLRWTILLAQTAGANEASSAPVFSYLPIVLFLLVAAAFPGGRASGHAGDQAPNL
jgi:hypothetical protein